MKAESVARCLLASLAVALLLCGAVQAELSGSATVVDGDTLRLGGQNVRLHGIDVPERKQTCLVAGKRWACGRAAARALAKRVAGRSVSCTATDRDRYGRVVTVCRAADVDLNAWMVTNGWALAYRRYSTDYVAEE